MTAGTLLRFGILVSVAGISACTNSSKKVAQPAIKLPEPEPVVLAPVHKPLEPLATVAAERARGIFKINKSLAKQSDLLSAFELSDLQEKKQAKTEDFLSLLAVAKEDIRNEVLRDYFRYRCKEGEKRSATVDTLAARVDLSQKLEEMQLSSPSALDHFARKALKDRCFVSGKPAKKSSGGVTVASRFKKHNAQKDPFFKSVLGEACDRDGEDAWYRWAKRSALGPFELLLFKAKLAGCRGRHEAATGFGEKLMRSRAVSLREAGMQVHIGRKLVKWMRSTRSRVKLSAMYEDLVKTWDRRGLLPLHVGMTDRKFATERENMRIWSARYLALTGGYQKALVALAMARQKLVSMMGSGVGSKKAKLDLLAESFHVEAFRVLIEQKKYAQASEVYLFAVKNHDFAATWKAKFLWYAGLFAHISGDSSLALQHWSRVAGFDPKETYQSKILFWSAKAYLALGKKRRARDLWKELKKESAIGYYTLVVGRNLAIENGWYAEVMSSLVAEAKPYALSETMQEDIIRIAGRDLWERYLLASNIGASKWTRLVGFEILARLKNKRKFIRNTDFAREFYALLSSTGLHYKHIYFQTLLSNKVDDFWRRYPRQFSVYFPATYAKRISESIDRIHGTTVDKNLVLGLVRQESSFRETVGSGAGAYGLMQITPSTARGLEPKWAGKSETFVQSKLREADSNLKLGIKNLDKLARKYSKFGGLAEAAILSAYNAGEEVTDRWLSYRRVKDPDAWTELVPFGETQKYIKFVTRNQTALRLIGKTSQQLSAQ